MKHQVIISKNGDKKYVGSSYFGASLIEFIVSKEFLLHEQIVRMDEYSSRHGVLGSVQFEWAIRLLCKKRNSLPHGTLDPHPMRIDDPNSKPALPPHGLDPYPSCCCAA